MKNKIKKILKESLLKKDYRKRMIYGTSLFGESKDEWELYDSLVLELRKIGDDKLIDEIRYKISDEFSEPEGVVKEVLDKIKYKNKQIKILEEKLLSHFIEKINKQTQYYRQH